jgi:TonB family protein
MKSILLTLATLSFVVLFSFTNINAQSGPYPGAVDAKLLSAPAPEYPDAAKKTGIGGKVMVQVALDAEGKVSSVTSVSGPDSVCSTITYPDVVALREAARTAALKAKFAPATRDGNPVESSMRISYGFKGTHPKSQYAAIPVSGKTEAENKVGADLGGTVAGKTFSSGALNGKAISLPKPPYPPAARAVRASGAVSVQVLIDENGFVYTAEAISGHPLLQAASVIAACGAKFSPTFFEGNPVKVSGIITYNFVP